MTIQKYFPLDAELEVRAVGSAALTADGYLGNQIDLKSGVYTDMVLVLNLGTTKVSAGNETYTIRVVGSNTADRSDARTLGMIEIGDAAGKTLDTADDVSGDQIVVPFATQRPAGVFHRYLDAHLDVGGTAPSIVVGAFFSKPM